MARIPNIALQLNRLGAIIPAIGQSCQLATTPRVSQTMRNRRAQQKAQSPASTEGVASRSGRRNAIGIWYFSRFSDRPGKSTKATDGDGRTRHSGRYPAKSISLGGKW